MELTRLPCGTANCYLIQTGEGAFLVDTGPPGAMDQLSARLKAVGTAPESIRLILLTHGHMDHAGNAREFQQRYGTRIAMHPADQELGPVSSRGLMGKVILGLSQKLLKEALPFQPDILLEGGMNLSGRELSCEIIGLPGHTKGSVAFFFPESGDLICGDMYMNFTNPSKAHMFEDAALLEQSHRALLDHPITTVHPGHGRSFALSQIK